MVRKALGVLDVKVTPGTGNVSISPAHVVDGRRSVLSKKTDVTLSHILGAKEFFNTFPAENFTYLRKPTSWAGSGHSQLSYKARKTKTSPQHKKEEKDVSEPVKEESATVTEVSPVAHALKEDRSNTPTEPQITEDGVEVESQKIPDAVVPVATEATETTEASPAETKDAKQPEVVEEAQRQEEKSQVETPKEDDQPSATSTGDAEAEKESPPPQEATAEPTTAVEAEASTEAPVIPIQHPTEEEKTSTVTEPLDETLAATESRNETEEAVKEEEAIDSEADEATEKKINVTEEEKVPADVPEAEEDKEDTDKPGAESDTPEEVSKKKKKPSESEKPKKKDAAEKSPDAKPPDTLETYSQFTQRVNAEKKNDSKLTQLCESFGCVVKPFSGQACIYGKGFISILGISRGNLTV